MKKEIFLLRAAFLLVPAFFACSCSTGGAIDQILGMSSEAPVFLECRPVSAVEVDFSFSRPVRVLAIAFDPPAEVESVGEGDLVQVRFSASLGIGESRTADILVEDGEGNTLNVIIPFRGRNDRFPPLVINELRTEYKSPAGPAGEFVELRTLGPGNLGALRLFISKEGLSDPVYEFPAAEVKEGEYIVLHLRTLEAGVETADETGEDLALSGGTEARPEARDFWIGGSTELLGKTDAVWIMDQDDTVLDGVILSEDPAKWTPKKYDMAVFAEFLSARNGWLPLEEGEDGNGTPGPQDAVSTKSVGSSFTKSVSRDEASGDSNRSSDWFVTDKNGATPGTKNVERPPVPET
jgi:hypothetical protein